MVGTLQEGSFETYTSKSVFNNYAAFNNTILI